MCSDQATITGVSNDLGFRFIFSEQLKYQGKKGDVVFGMSGSGNSQNVLEAFRVAKNVRHISIAPLLGEAVKRIHMERSVSSLFD